MKNLGFLRQAGVLTNLPDLRTNHSICVVLLVEAVIGELVSARLFPVLRENTGKFANLSLETTMIRRVRSVNSTAYQGLP